MMILIQIRIIVSFLYFVYSWACRLYCSVTMMQLRKKRRAVHQPAKHRRHRRRKWMAPPSLDSVRSEKALWGLALIWVVSHGLQGPSSVRWVMRYCITLSTEAQRTRAEQIVFCQIFLKMSLCLL